jgi:hypothetical protein
MVANCSLSGATVTGGAMICTPRIGMRESKTEAWFSMHSLSLSFHLYWFIMGSSILMAIIRFSTTLRTSSVWFETFQVGSGCCCHKRGNRGLCKPLGEGSHAGGRYHCPTSQRGG